MALSSPIIEVDVHGLNRYQAKIKIESVLKRNPKAYRIRVIHGFNNGTELKEMVRFEFSHHPSVIRVVPGTNQGITELILREYF